MKICPNCKNGVEDDVKLCPNCNAFIAGAPVMSQKQFHKVEKYIEKSNDNINGEYVSKPVKNSVYSVISFICSIISILGILAIPFFFDFSIAALLFGVDLYSTVIIPNIVFIISGLLALILGNKHKKMYNKVCTGYVIGIVVTTIYALLIIYILVTYIRVSGKYH